jgi:hypothetical protein
MPPLPRDLDWLELCAINDAHVSDPLFYERGFDRYLSMILESERKYAVLGGDLMNMATKNSVSDVYTAKLSPKGQLEWMADRLMPLAKAGKILGAVGGNHEGRVAKEVDFDPTEMLMTKLGLPWAYRDSGIIIILKFGAGFDRHKESPYTYKLYMTHGFGGARTTGGKVAKGERISTFVVADAYLMAHDHTVSAFPKVILNPDTRGADIEGAPGWQSGWTSSIRTEIIKSNAWLKWGGYGERGGFSPTDLVPPTIYFKGNTDRNDSVLPWWGERYDKEVRTFV